jgi:hypothetical protein
MATKPRFQVRKLTGKHTRTILKPLMTKDNDGKPVSAGGFSEKEIEENAGWMISFPTGSSIYVHTKAEMKRLGFDKPADIVDTETGEVVGKVHDFEAIGQQKSARNSRHSAANL